MESDSLIFRSSGVVRKFDWNLYISVKLLRKVDSNKFLYLYGISFVISLWALKDRRDNIAFFFLRETFNYLILPTDNINHIWLA